MLILHEYLYTCIVHHIRKRKIFRLSNWTNNFFELGSSKAYLGRFFLVVTLLWPPVCKGRLMTEITKEANSFMLKFHGRYAWLSYIHAISCQVVHCNQRYSVTVIQQLVCRYRDVNKGIGIHFSTRFVKMLRMPSINYLVECSMQCGP